MKKTFKVEFILEADGDIDERAILFSLSRKSQLIFYIENHKGEDIRLYPFDYSRTAKVKEV